MKTRCILAAGMMTVALPALADDPVKLVVLPYLSQAPIFIAIAEGYFDAEGIAVETVEMRSSVPASPGLMSGEFDAAMGVPTAGFYNAITQGGAARVVGPGIVFSTQAACDYAVYYGRKGFEKPALSAGDALPVTLSADPITFEGYLSEKLLTQPGAEKLVFTHMEMPAYTQGEALKAGSIDVAFTSEPWVTRFNRDDIGGIAFGASEILPDAQYGALIFSGRLTADDPELGHRVKRAFDAAIVQYNQGKTDRNVEILAKYTGLDPDLITEACWAYVPSDGEVRTNSMTAYQTWLRDKGAVDEVLPAEAFIATINTQ